MDHITLAKKAAELYAKYFVTVDKTGWRGNEHFDAKVVDAHVASILRGAGLEKYEGSGLANAFGTYGTVIKVRNYLNELEAIAQRALPSSNQMFSTSTGSTYTPEFHRALHKELLAASAARHAYNETVEGWFPVVEGEMGKLAHEAQELYQKFIEKGKGELVVTFYIHILQKCLQDKELVRDILRELELIKTSVLRGSIVPVGKQNRKSGIQQLIILYGLRSVCEPCDLATLFGMVNIKTSKTLEKTCEAAAKLLGAVIIVINRSIKDPAIYKLPPPPRKTGPTLDFLRECVTVQPLDCPQYKGESIVRHGSGVHCYVVDVVCDNQYRWLSPFGNMLPIPGHLLARLGENPVSERLAGYNAVLSAEILKELDEPLVVDAPRVEDTYWKNLRGLILDKVFRKLGTARDPEKVARMLTNTAEELLQVNMIAVNVTPLQQAQYKEEVRMSTSSLVNDLYERILNMLVKPVTRDMCETALERSITSKSNLYKALETKNDLLSGTLLHPGGK